MKLKAIIIYFFLGLLSCNAKSAIGPIDIFLNENDPLEETINRPFFEFNQVLDKNIMEPVAVSYRDNIPTEIQSGVSNFFSNLSDIKTLANQILQFKLAEGTETLGRLLVNTTVGILGVFDVASEIGLSKTNEDFGQTLGYWGVPEGPYIVLPILGPSSLRDTAGLYIDLSSDLNVINNLDGTEELAATSLKTIDKRVELLPATDLINRSFDPYITMRSAYRQKRQNEINDGKGVNSSSDF